MCGRSCSDIPQPLSSTVKKIWSSSLAIKTVIWCPFWVNLIALDNRLFNILLTLSLSIHPCISEESEKYWKFIPFCSARGLKLSSIASNKCAIFVSCIDNGRASLSIFRRSKNWLIKLDRRFVLCWIIWSLEIMNVSSVGCLTNSCKGALIRVSGVFISCAILVWNFSLLSFISLSCILSNCSMCSLYFSFSCLL